LSFGITLAFSPGGGFIGPKISAGRASLADEGDETAECSGYPLCFYQIQSGWLGRVRSQGG
jgi:hypothetical protein